MARSSRHREPASRTAGQCKAITSQASPDFPCAALRLAREQTPMHNIHVNNPNPPRGHQHMSPPRSSLFLHQHPQPITPAYLLDHLPDAYADAALVLFLSCAPTPRDAQTPSCTETRDAASNARLPASHDNPAPGNVPVHQPGGGSSPIRRRQGQRLVHDRPEELHNRAVAARRGGRPPETRVRCLR